MNDENQPAQVRLAKTGDLVLRADGQDTLIGHYTRASGHLEYESREFSVKYHTQVTSRIGTVQKGTQSSGMVIKTIGIKGEAPPKMPTTKRPRLGPSGDAAYDIVKWYLENDISQAILRYGIYVDADANPIQRPCVRLVDEMIDQRAEVEDDQLEWNKDPGKATQSRSAVRRGRERYENPAGYVARRATNAGPNGEPPLTFTPQEVVGGFTPEDGDEVLDAIIPGGEGGES